MGGIVMMDLKCDIIEGTGKPLQGMDDDKSRMDFLCEFLYDVLAYLDEEELNNVKEWTTRGDY